VDDAGRWAHGHHSIKESKLVDERMRWARKVSQAKIRQLYQADAMGIVDEELIDKVGTALYACCQSILLIEGNHSQVMAFLDKLWSSHPSERYRPSSVLAASSWPLSSSLPSCGPIGVWCSALCTS
jgi:hypothetical protein